MGKTNVLMNKPIHLGQALLYLSKLVMHEFHYDYMIPKYSGDLKLQSGVPALGLCYMDIDSLVYHIKTEDFYVDVAEDVEARFDMRGYDKADARQLPPGKNKKIIGLTKDKLGGKIMTGFVALRSKSYAYKKLGNKEDKKCKRNHEMHCERKNKETKKKTISFNDDKNCLLDVKNKNMYRSQVMFRNNKHEIHSVEVNKVALTLYGMGGGGG